MKNISGFYSIKNDEVLKIVRSNLNGLSQHEAAERKKSGETNSFEPSKKQSVIKKFLSQFKDLMVIILIISAVLSITISITSGEYQNLMEGGIIVFIVLLNATMGVVQESKAENALESLKKQTEPFANVLRDGIYQSVKIEDIVVGDIVMLSSGNIVPADLRLLESYNLKTNESALTGESGQVEKNADLVLNEKSPLGERKNMAYRGSSVVCGRGVGVVVGVGKNTEMGKIASMITTGKKEQTPLQKSLSKQLKEHKPSSLSVIVLNREQLQD